MSTDNFEFDKEILDGFLDDSFEILQVIKDELSLFTSSKDSKCFERFGQNIDRIMGAALTLELNDAGELAKLGKEIGYKASQIAELDKLLVIQSLLSQLTKELERGLRKLKTGESFESEEAKNILVKLKDVNQNLGDLRTSVKCE